MTLMAVDQKRLTQLMLTDNRNQPFARELRSFKPMAMERCMPDGSGHLTCSILTETGRDVLRSNPNAGHETIDNLVAVVNVHYRDEPQRICRVFQQLKEDRSYGIKPYENYLVCEPL